MLKSFRLGEDKPKYEMRNRPQESYKNYNYLQQNHSEIVES